MNKIKTVLLLLSTAGLLAACGEAESSAPVPTPTPSSSTSAPSSSSSSSSSQSSSSSASTGSTGSTGTQTAPTSQTQPTSTQTQPTSSDPEPTSSEPEPTSQSSDPSSEPEPSSSDPVEYNTYVVNGLPEWITMDDCVIFAWAWGGEAGEGAWLDLDFINEGEAASFEIEGEIDGFLLVRCFAGTEIPDWNASGDVAGRIYNKTNDITCIIGVYEYQSPEWVEYEGGSGGDPIDPPGPGPVDPGEEGTYVIDSLPDWITNDGCVIFAWAWGGEAGEGAWYALDFIEEGTAVSFDIDEGELDGMLLARCAAETTLPDWSIHTDEPGRVYNQTEDITCQPGVFRYTSPAWKEYK